MIDYKVWKGKWVKFKYFFYEMILKVKIENLLLFFGKL